MNFKGTVLFFTLLLVITGIKAQSDIDNFVNEGIQYHDQGDYEKAIETYKKALEINPKSSLVNYEIAYSYFSNGDYKNAVKHTDVVLDQNADHIIPAYIIKGSALDMQGKTKESIKLLEKAIKKTEGSYLLFYNLALNYYKLNELDSAEENAVKAIETNPNHASSHLMLANIHDQWGNSVQTLLAIHYFLFLEPNSERSVPAYQMLLKNFGGNVSKDDSKPNTINIMLSSSNDSQFGAAELMVSMLEASKSLEENEGKTEDELFVENTGSFFKVLGELRKKNNREIWWNFYTPFFYDLAKSDHLEAYCNYISQIGDESSKKWIEENEDKLTDFGNWLKNN